MGNSTECPGAREDNGGNSSARGAFVRAVGVIPLRAIRKASESGQTFASYGGEGEGGDSVAGSSTRGTIV